MSTHNNTILSEISQTHIVSRFLVAATEVYIKIMVDWRLKEIILKVRFLKNQHLTGICRVFHHLPPLIIQQVFYISLTIIGNVIIQKSGRIQSISFISGTHCKRT